MVTTRTGEGGNGFIALTPPAAETIPGPPRDFIGYAGEYPDPKWPKKAKLAINLVINFEEGSEASMYHGDNITEVVLTDGARSFGEGNRNMGAESLFEYGSRVGFWRLMKMFEESHPRPATHRPRPTLTLTLNLNLTLTHIRGQKHADYHLRLRFGARRPAQISGLYP